MNVTQKTLDTSAPEKTMFPRVGLRQNYEAEMGLNKARGRGPEARFTLRADVVAPKLPPRVQGDHGGCDYKRDHFELVFVHDGCPQEDDEEGHKHRGQDQAVQQRVPVVYHVGVIGFPGIRAEVEDVCGYLDQAVDAREDEENAAGHWHVERVLRGRGVESDAGFGRRGAEIERDGDV